MPSWVQCRRAFAWVDRLPARFTVAVATFGPLGRWGRAPGTNGTLAGLLVFAAAQPFLSAWVWAALSLPAVYLAVAFCDAAERRLGERDPGKMILDEVVAVPFCFIGVWPAAAEKGWPLWAVLVAGFVLFRLFDIVKPLGIGRLQRLPGGLGVVADDLAAALAVCVVLQAALRIL